MRQAWRSAPNGHNSATLDLDEIDRIWRAERQANLGIRTGQVTVLDVDTYKERGRLRCAKDGRRSLFRRSWLDASLGTSEVPE